MTHTYATMEVSQATFDEVKKKLEEADYHHAIMYDLREGIILDMRGIALILEKPKQ